MVITELQSVNSPMVFCQVTDQISVEHESPYRFMICVYSKGVHVRSLATSRDKRYINNKSAQLFIFDNLTLAKNYCLRMYNEYISTNKIN